MARIESAFLDLSYLDTLAFQETPVHRLDPRVKLVLTGIFILAVISFDKYTISAMLPYVLFLIAVMGLGNIKASFILKKLILVSPFAVMIGIFNPFFDQQTLTALGPVEISGGWISFSSILIRFGLTVGGVLVLIATTGFNGVCMSMERLGMPKVFAVQLLMLYRYIFVLIDEGQRMFIARTLRSFGNKKGMSIKIFGSMLGLLLLRTIDRAQRIHLAMLCRGFDGTIRISRKLQFTGWDLLVFLGASVLLIVPRLYDIPLMLGKFITTLLS